MPEEQEFLSRKSNRAKEPNIQSRPTDTESLAAIGRLVTKIAHELNNPIDGILRYINLSLRALEQKNVEKPKEYLVQCRTGLMRMVQIISELLEFARSTYALSEDHVPVKQLIEDAIKTMDVRAESQNVTIRLNCRSDLPTVRSGELFGVFCNLIKNALDAMPDGGQLNISTKLERDSLAVEFRDTGCGFAPEDAGAIFEPFYTTKDKGKGTGLGLAICRDIIDKRKGRITAANAPDRGSIFTVYLPASQDS